MKKEKVGIDGFCDTCKVIAKQEFIIFAKIKIKCAEGMSEKKMQLRGMTLQELESMVTEAGEPKYRAQQVFNWLYNQRVTSFDEMDNVPKSLRQYLSEKSIISSLSLQETNAEVGGTAKLLFKTQENHFIEAVLIPEGERQTLCISSQAGCPLDCKFCATGLMGYKKNLTSGEIIDQFFLASEKSSVPVTNIVFMGMGEPLLNYKEMVKALRIFGEEKTQGISLKKITVSTAGIAPKIREFAETGLKVKLALSLHSCFDDVRNEIMPINKKYSLDETIDAVHYYAKTTKTRITFEYVMLKNVNDRAEDIKALAKLVHRIPSKINVIPFNSLKHMNPDGIAATLEPTPSEEIEKFADALREKGVTVMVRNTQGNEIAAACGQLAVKY